LIGFGQEYTHANNQRNLMGLRRIGSPQRKKSRAKVHRRNAIRKARARLSRDRTMLELVKARPLPYVPGVMSWLSARLDKPASQITQADVDALNASSAS